MIIVCVDRFLQQDKALRVCRVVNRDGISRPGLGKNGIGRKESLFFIPGDIPGEKDR